MSNVTDVLITDRTQADVNLQNDKGCYNYTDLNRVATVGNQLVELLNSLGYSPSLKTNFKTDWTMYDYPTENLIVIYLDSIYNVVKGFYALKDYNLPTTLQNFNYEDANNIEQAMKDIEIIMNSIKETWNVQSGTFYSGYNGLRGYAI